MENKIIDPWTFIHALIGFNIGSVTKSRTVGYSLIVGYEVVENLFLVGPIFQNEEGWINIISDVAFGIGAFELARKYGDKKI